MTTRRSVWVGFVLAVLSIGTAFAQTAGPARTVFLNPFGGTYYPGGSDDPATNQSILVTSRSTVPPFSGTDEQWKFLVDSVRARYAPFGVSIVDVEPPPTEHYIEAVVGGLPGDIGLPSGISGIAAIACQPQTKAIVFIFSEAFGDDLETLAVDIDHEVGHAFTLDHEIRCKDPMTYLGGCREKVFQNQTANCGEFSARPCYCGGTTQDSFEKLRSVLGSHDGTIKPTPQPQGSAADTAPVAICATPLLTSN